MSYQRIHQTPEGTELPGCVYLRSKAMYVTGDFNPRHVDEMGSHACWCNLTQHVLGPDDRPVERLACVPGRDCFRASR